MEKILFIGGTRFFGRDIVRRLASENYELYLLTRGNSQLPVKPRGHFKGDRKDRQLLACIFKEHYFDFIIDNIGYRQEDIRLLIAEGKGRFGKYLFTSTVTVYLDRFREKAILDESDLSFDYQPKFFESDILDYAMNKIACEKFLWQECTEDFLITRPSYVIAEDNFSLRCYYYIERILDGGPILIPKGSCQLRLVYAQDLADVYVKLVKRDSLSREAFNISSDEPLAIEEFIKIIADTLEKPVYVSAMDYSEFVRLDLKLPYQFNQNLSIDKLKRTIDFHPTNIRKILPDVVRWYVDNIPQNHSLNYEKRDLETELANSIEMYRL